MASSPKATDSSSVRFPPTAGKTTITMSTVASKKTDNTSSSASSSSKMSKLSTGLASGAKPPPTTAAAAPSSSSSSANARPPRGAKGAFTRAKTIVGLDVSSAESARMKQDKERIANWKRWGPYLSERQWATVREDYSADGNWCVSTCACVKKKGANWSLVTPGNWRTINIFINNKHLR